MPWQDDCCGQLRGHESLFSLDDDFSLQQPVPGTAHRSAVAVRCWPPQHKPWWHHSGQVMTAATTTSEMMRGFIDSIPGVIPFLFYLADRGTAIGISEQLDRPSAAVRR